MSETHPAIAVSKIIFREDLYPRFEANQALIQRYSDSIEQLPPIKINQNNILIDGFHRWKAHQLAGETEIAIEVIKTTSEKELKRMAYQLNSNHGLQLSGDEKRKYAIEMIGEMSVQELSNILFVSESTIKRWTVTQRELLEKERNRKILELYLHAQYTQEMIAEMLGIPQKTVSNILSQIDQMVDLAKDFKPPLYNIWKLDKQDNATAHFGSFPLFFMKSLLYYHTKPFDIICDPFAGGGTTVDACKEMLRRYYCTDLIVKPGREKDIQQHNVKNGLPKEMPKPDLVFLDPPYWKQAEGLYSNSPDDLSNMTLIDFYDAINNLLSEIKDRKINKIAFVIQPTQYKNDFIWEDHIFKINPMLSDKYEIEMRYILPYSTQQYNAQMVDIAKEKNKCLCLNRDLVIWKRNDTKA